MLNKTGSLFLLSILFVLGLSGCLKEENILSDTDALLGFSKDSILFDTVFTTSGSATRSVKVYNPYKEKIRISRIWLENQSDPFFRLNIDGTPGNDQREIEIAPFDSMYIFVEVTIHPDDPLEASPFIISDQILFETNGNTQGVMLEAWGQNANYLPGKFNKGSGALLACDFQELTLDDPRPYVVHGILLIDSCDLILPPGTRIYVHGGLVRATDADGMRFFYNDGRIFVGPNGRLRSQGTASEPVIIQGDRLEASFAEEPGQWYGIILSAGSVGNSFQFTTIKNSILGLAADSAAQMTLENAQVFNASGNGIIGIQASITATNCLFANNGAEAVNLLYGGNYSFTYCTLVGKSTTAPALTLSNVLCLDPFCSDYRTGGLDAAFTNCIIYGPSKDEINLVKAPDENVPFSFTFEHCIFRIDELDDADPWVNFLEDFTSNCLIPTSESVLFINPSEQDYHLDTFSLAEGKAIPIPGIFLDLDNKERDPSTPDIGCYEFQ